MRSLPPLLAFVAAALIAGCASGPASPGAGVAGGAGTFGGPSVIGGRNSRSSMLLTDPMPVLLGERAIGTVARTRPALVAADSVLREWGFELLSANDERAELRTDWLYFTTPMFTPRSGTLCETAAAIAVRLTIRPRDRSADSTRFVVRGEARLPGDQAGSAPARIARDGLATIANALTEGLRYSDQSTDTLPVTLGTLSSALGATYGQSRTCGSSRP